MPPKAVSLEKELIAAEDISIPQRPGRHRSDIQEWTRLVLAVALVLPITILGLAVPVDLLWVHNPPPEQVEHIVLAVLGPFSGLAGAVLGFYFGEQVRRRRG